MLSNAWDVGSILVGELRPYRLCGLAKKGGKKDWKKYLKQFKAKSFKRDGDVISIEETIIKYMKLFPTKRQNLKGTEMKVT